MIRPKLLLIGCCVAVVGLMTFSVSPACAESGADWLLINAQGWTVFLEAEIGLREDSLLQVLHTKIGGASVLFSCTWIEAINAKLKVNGSIGEGTQIKFFNCSTSLNGALSKVCEPKDIVYGWGSIVTKPLHGLLVLHELAAGSKDELVSFLPDSVGGKASEILATIEMSKECSIGTKVPLIGKFTVKDCQGLLLTHLVEHLLETGPLTEMWAISKTAEHAAALLGSAWAYLIGAHTGLQFSGDPA